MYMPVIPELKWRQEDCEIVASTWATKPASKKNTEKKILGVAAHAYNCSTLEVEATGQATMWGQSLGYMKEPCLFKKKKKEKACPKS